MTKEAQTQAFEAEQQPEDVAAAADEPAEALAALSAERDEWKDKAYRLAADMENLRKRTQREVEDARKYAVSNFARELLGVSDNMVRAIEALEQAKADKSAIEGVQMVETQLQNAFQKLDIAKIEAIGQKLDPNLHQAMFEVPTDDAEPGTVVQELQAGYTIAGRLLRPALVGVAKKA